MLYDCYNFRHSQTAFYMSKKGSPVTIDTATDGITYIRYGTGDLCSIHRITETDGVINIGWALGAWNDRANLDYSTGLDEAINH